MIHLITGQPGAGKTLYALNYVQQRSEFKDRSVYYNGINDLKLPWAEMDKGEDWHKLPAGSVVVLDECQRIFRPRGNGSVVPEHVEKLETHRHAGLDIVLITQHPMLVDSNVRRLVGRHMHVVRSFGMQRSTVHEWGEVKEQCDKTRSDSVRHEFSYPKEAFGWYKSAEVHTHKRRIPPRVFFLLLLPLILAASVYVMWQYWQTRGPKPVTQPGQTVQGQIVKAAPPPSGKASLTEYFDSYKPRVEGLAYTAPRFDDLTKPDTAPFPGLCIASSNKCICYTDQGTRIDTGEKLCRDIVAKGLFKEFGGASRQFASGPASPAQSTPVAHPAASSAAAGSEPLPPGSVGAALAGSGHRPPAPAPAPRGIALGAPSGRGA